MSNPLQRAFLSEHWRSVFAAAPPASLILDIACGDGAVFAIARNEAGSAARLVAVDAAPAAVSRAMNVAPEILGVASDAERLPFRAGAADLAVSQFGVEYGGTPAFAEAARVVKPGGRFSAICHFKDGAISAECAQNNALLEAFASEDVFTLMRQSLGATYARGEGAMTQQEIAFERNFADALQRAAQRVRRSSDCPAKAALTSALREMAGVASRRLAYDSPTAFSFIDHVESSLTAYAGRMRSMLAAAMSEDDMRAVVEVFRASNMTELSAKPVAFGQGGAPSAWLLDARRL